MTRSYTRGVHVVKASTQVKLAKSFRRENEFLFVYLFVIFFALTACQGLPVVSTPVPVEPERDIPTSVRPAGSGASFSQLATLIPGYEATPEAHPSGVFQDFHEHIQIHDSCFANNTTNFPGDLNWTAAISALNANADNHYWGDPSGPSGMGTGTGDNIGKLIVFEPVQTVRPEYCDPALSEQN